MITTTVPEKVTQTAAMVLEAGQIKRGDVFSRGKKMVEAATVKVGPKNAEVLDKDDKSILYMAKENPVTVYREIETDESKAAREKALKADYLERELRDWKPSTEAVAGSLLEQAQEHGQVRAYTVADLINSQARDQVWYEWAGAHHYLTEGRREEDGGTVGTVEALQKFMEQQQRRLLNQFPHNALSRSTSVVDNAMEDANRSAVARFLDEHRYHI